MACIYVHMSMKEAYAEENNIPETRKSGVRRHYHHQISISSGDYLSNFLLQWHDDDDDDDDGEI